MGLQQRTDGADRREAMGGGQSMATAHEQQLAKDIVVAWLTSRPATGPVPLQDLQDPVKAGKMIADLYKTIVKAISETSSAGEGRDATG
jgi:hypothetical protein